MQRLKILKTWWQIKSGKSGNITKFNIGQKSEKNLVTKIVCSLRCGLCV